MCWSAPVSFAFVTFDVTVICFLLSRRRGRDVTYAYLLGSVACQEWAQFLVWITHSAVETQDDCTLTKALTGTGTFLGSASIPIVLIWRSVVDSKVLEEPIQQTLFASQVKALTLWIISTIMALAAAALTNSYCVTIGPRHHQVWICAGGIFELGGYPLYFSSLAMYAVSISYGLEALSLPHRERLWIGWIGFLCGVVSYGMYFYTLEACSIWCWSAFSVGIYALCRPIVQKEESQHESQQTEVDIEDWGDETTKLATSQVYLYPSYFIHESRD